MIALVGLRAIVISSGSILLISRPMPPFAIPPTLHDSFMARLDRFDTAKELAQTGAAIGRSFARGLLEVVAGLPPAEVDQALGRLEESGLIMRRGRGCGWRIGSYAATGS